MTDLKIIVDGNGTLDLSFDGTDIKTTDDLETSILISILLIARANPDDQLPDFSQSRRGWFGDDFNEFQADTTGSKLWLLTRSKNTADLLPRLNQTFEDCLAWMVQDGVAQSVTASSSFFGGEVVSIEIIIVRPNVADRKYEFYYNWQAQLFSDTLELVT